MSRSTFVKAELQFLARMRVGHLATADANGQPHVVPIVFVESDGLVFTPLDEKPKRVAPMQLRRVRNIQANPKVAIVVDHYSEDWSHLGWVLIRGVAELVFEGERHAAATSELRQKYAQYADAQTEQRPMIVVRPTRIGHWGELDG